MNIEEKVKDLAARLGKDVKEVWDEVEAIVEGKHATAKAAAEAPEKAPDAPGATEAPKPPEAPTEAPGEAGTGGAAA